MTPLRDSIRDFFSPAQPIPAGVYHYQAPPEDPRNYRLHLRVEKDGDGVLIVNAAAILHLNLTATEYAFYLIQNMPREQVARNMASRYRVSREQAEKDYQRFLDRIQTLIETPDLDPITFLDFERQQPFSGEISAPYRLDCALTYRLPAGSNIESAPTKQVERELTSIEWKSVLEKAWAAGIPHVVFTGGEPTLRDDLADLIAYAEAKNQVTGLLSDGLRLVDESYLESLLQTGLDHLMLILQPGQELSWKALENALAADLFVAVHLTVTPENAPEAASILERLAVMGVKALSLSAVDPGLRDNLEALRDRASLKDIELVWNLPVPYSDLNPVSFETEGMELAEGAGKAWLYVEPDGDVLPTQGARQGLGNLLRDSWGTIWKGSG